MLNTKELVEKSKLLRQDVLRMITEAGNGHPGGSLSALDIILYLYANEMKHNVKEPKMPERDRFILSKGHGVPALYSVLADFGYFSKEKLLDLRKLGSPLQGHPANRLLSCIEASTGSLGQGLSVALGMALGAKIHSSQSPKYRVFAMLGDGEMQEGQVWEALMSAAFYGVSNLCIFIDRNNGQIDGLVDDVMSIEPLEDKLKSFGLKTLTIDGHNFDEIRKSIDFFKSNKDRPTAIIAKTIKGKGVSFLEKDTVSWHGKALTKDQLDQAITELSRDE